MSSKRSTILTVRSTRGLSAKSRQWGLRLKKRTPRRNTLHAFINDLSSRHNVLEAYNEDIWSYLVDKGIVNRDRSITFLFRNGKEIKIN